MRFLLDSTAVIAVLKGQPAFRTQLRRHRPADLGMSAIVPHELCFGACGSQRRAANLAQLDALPFEVVAFDREDAQRAGAIRAELAAADRPIGPSDVLIAGQALARGLVLITHNTHEFGRVPNLMWDDWEQRYAGRLPAPAFPLAAIGGGQPVPDNKDADRTTASWLRVLLILPVLGVLWVPLYNRAPPALFSVPFFYWYQLLWILLCTVCIGIVYLTEHRETTA